MAIFQHCKCGAQLAATAETCPFCKTVLKVEKPEPEPKPKRKRRQGKWEPIKGVYGTGHRSPGLTRFLNLKAFVAVLLVVTGGVYLYSLIPQMQPPEHPPPQRRAAPAPLILPSRARTTDAWYKGGTLSSASLASWSRSSYRNRLATAADMAARIWMGRLSSMDALRPKAVALTVCINEVATAPSASSVTVRETAAACAVKLGWP